MNRPSKQPFTLIELLVVMALGILLAAIGVPAFTRMNAGGALLRSADTLRTAFGQAQSQAAAQRRSVALLFNYDETHKIGNGRYFIDGGNVPAVRCCYVDKSGADFNFAGFVPGSRWIQLDQNVVLPGGKHDSAGEVKFPDDKKKPDFPDADGLDEVKKVLYNPDSAADEVDLKAVIFNPYGGITNGQVTLLLAEGVLDDGGNVVYSNKDRGGRQPANYVKLLASSFTGKVKLRFAGEEEKE